MTLLEAAGIQGNIDIETGKKLTHREIYRKCVKILGGVDALAEYLPIPIDAVRKKLETDSNLNNISYRAWCAMAGFTIDRGDCKPTGYGLWGLCHKHNIDMMSCSEGVCVLKEAARILASSGS